MFRKNYFTNLLSIAILLTASAAVFAQTAVTNGTVQLQKADGTKIPVDGAVIDVFRTDVKGKPPGTKTNKKGEFTFAGLLVGGTYALSVSAPGAKPELVQNIKAGQERISVILLEGDGHRWTEEEVRKALSSSGSSGGEMKPDPKTEEEAKKAQAEYEAKVKEITAKNEKIKQNTALIQTALKEGNDAFAAKNYDVAVAKYNEGINIEPDYIGSVPILGNNKATVLKTRAIDTYNKFVKSSDATAKAEAMGRVKADLTEALGAYSRSFTMLKNAPATETANITNVEATKFTALAGMTEIYRLLVVTNSDLSRATEAKPIYLEYLAVETDPAKKLKAQVTLGDIMREAANSEEAVAAYRTALETAPDNPEAMAGLGLSLFNLGVINNDQQQKQEGLNIMQKFVDVSPVADTDSPYMKTLKVSVKEAVEYLKTQEKLTPQKLPKTTTTKKKG